MRQRGLTLTELLITVAILAALAALLFPLLTSTRAAAQQTTCLQNFRQAGLALGLYLGDYDESFVPARWNVAPDANALNDRTWVQLVLPYLGDFRSTQCPADSSHRHADAVFDVDLAASAADFRLYNASQRVNLGYNQAYLSPFIKDSTLAGPMPRTLSQLESPHATFALLDSVFGLTEAGSPFGGGYFVVVPPCRYTSSAESPEDSFATALEGTIVTDTKGWQADSQTSDRESGLTFGNVWPWHQGRATTLNVDGSARSLTLARITAGCDVQARWKGLILDPTAYLWDLQ